MSTKQTWVFYGSQHGETTKTIHFIKECKNPGRTKEYKHMMELLDQGEYLIIGRTTATKWNTEHSLIKIGV
tara:strand:+ start:393 stop:605 length:213 start_codon:yes stop_codon:yes gene_type:complete